jgi:hypothetical protein
MRISMLCRLALPVLAAASLLSASPSRADLSASAQVTATQLGGGEYQYDVTLNDTGTTNVGTFWFSWVPGKDFMSVSPSGVLSPTGWVDAITHGGASDGYAIQWIDDGAALTSGNSLSGFQFDSPLTPAQLAAASPINSAFPTATSFVYIGKPFADPGSQFVASITPSATPEPGTLAITALGLGLLAIFRRSTMA